MAVASDSLITVEDYKSWKDIENSEIEANAISVYGIDGTAATVAKSGNTLTLVKTGGTGAGTTNIDLTNVLYDTLGELATYINSLAGWVANLIGWASADSTDIKNVSATSCLLEANAHSIVYYDNYTIERMIDMASDVIEKYLNRKIKSATYTHERYHGGKDMIFLKQFPVTAVTQVCNGYEEPIRIKNTSGKFNAYAIVSSTGVNLVVDGTPVGEKTFVAYPTMTTLAAELNAQAGWEAVVVTSSFDDWPSNQLFVNPNLFCLDTNTYLKCPAEPLEDYTVDMDDGIIHLPGGFAGGYRDVLVTYVAGYSTVPDDIIYATCRFVSWMDDQREEDEGMKSEKLGDYQYTRADLEKALSAEEIGALRRHRRYMIT